MEWSVEAIADLTKAALWLSLVLFCVAFVAEAMSFRPETKRALFWPFIAVEFLHILLVLTLFAAGGVPLSWTVILLAWGLVNYAWVIVTIRKRWGRGGRLVIPVYVTWYIWFLFTGGLVLEQVDGADSPVMVPVLLALAFACAATRIVLQLKPR